MRFNYKSKRRQSHKQQLSLWQPIPTLRTAMLPTDPQAGPEAAEIYSCIDIDMDMVAAEDTAEVAEMANTAAELKRLPHAGTASGLATRKTIAVPKGGPKKLKHNDLKDETHK